MTNFTDAENVYIENTVKRIMADPNFVARQAIERIKIAIDHKDASARYILIHQTILDRCEGQQT